MAKKRLRILDLIIYISLFLFFAFQNIKALVNSGDYDIFVVFTFDIVGLLSFINITIKTEKFNIYSIINFFVFFFFYYCGLNQYLSNWVAWRSYFGEVAFKSDNYVLVNIIIILFLLIIDCSYFIKRKPNKENKEKNRTTLADRIELTDTVIAILTIINIFVMLFFVKTYGIKGLLSRYDSHPSVSNQYTRQIVDVFLRFTPCTICLFLIFNGNVITFKKYSLYYIVNFLILILVIFPLGGTARYMIAAAYLSLGYILIRKLNFKSFIVLLLLFGLVVIFPNLNYFRSHSITELKDFRFQTLNVNYGDFDAYSMLLYIIKYSNTEGYCLGKNILSAFLFFVPRTLWPTKMVGTGSLVATSYNSSFTNISAPFVAECYFAFGFLGVIVISFVLGIIIKRMDDNLLSKNIVAYGFSSIIFGMIMFIMRGDMLSSFAYTFAFLLNFMLIMLFISLFMNKVK